VALRWRRLVPERGGAGGTRPPARWRCALVNNMPDSALVATERQFGGLLDSASGCETVEVARYTLPGVPRDEAAAGRIAEEYLPLGDLESAPPDLVIVTGSNPIEERIEDEPYWSELVDLLQWGRDSVATMVLSCLSAHAALSVFDGLERSRLGSKCTGVFPQRASSSHRLAAGLGEDFVLPHSRLNTVDHRAVSDAGYATVIDSPEVGWTMIAKRVGAADIVLVQGHPEYEPSSLLREYMRDVRRYVLHQRDEQPCLPFRCVADEDWERLVDLHERVIGGRREMALLEAFPFDEVAERAPWAWRPTALRLAANLLTAVPTRSV
jgi:homoserine O-succinyltransferase/O-acetyltransferase